MVPPPKVKTFNFTIKELDGSRSLYLANFLLNPNSKDIHSSTYTTDNLFLNEFFDSISLSYSTLNKPIIIYVYKAG